MTEPEIKPNVKLIDTNGNVLTPRISDLKFQD